VTNLGSVKNLTRVAALDSEEGCSCGQKLSQCEFWRSVAQVLHESTGRTLEHLDVNSTDRAVFQSDNRQLFDAVAIASGCSFIVDSSRTAQRLQMLQVAFGANVVVPVHIYRRPEGQLNSWKRTQKDRRYYLGLLLEYYRLHVSRLRACSGAATMRIVSYERLCDAPAETLATILDAVGQTPAPDLLSTWGETPTHVLGGNRMLRTTDSTIRLDDNWKTGLTGWEAALARFGCAPIYSHLQHRADQPSGR
jgi:hypothetical protein